MVTENRQAGRPPSLIHRGLLTIDRTWTQLPGAVRFALMSLLWVVVSAVVAFRFIAAHQAFSYQDEYTYLDYIDKAAHGVLLRRNMLIDPYTANELACRGMERFGPIVSGCGGTVNYDDLPIDGFSTGTIHSPVYFYVAALLTKPMTAFAGATMFTAARMTGAVFLGLGIAVLWVLMKELGASRSVALAGSLLLLVSPQTWWSNFYITPDAVNILAGATILLAALQMVRGRWSPVWFVLASIFFALVKFQGVFAAGAALVFITAYAIFGNSRRGLRRSWLAWGIGGTILALAVQLGWQWLRLCRTRRTRPMSLTSPHPSGLSTHLTRWVLSSSTSTWAPPVISRASVSTTATSCLRRSSLRLLWLLRLCSMSPSHASDEFSCRACLPPCFSWDRLSTLT